MEQLTAETQGSSGSETSGYVGVYVPRAADVKGPRAGRLWAPALKIDEISSLYFAYTCSSRLYRAPVILTEKRTVRIGSSRKLFDRRFPRRAQFCNQISERSWEQFITSFSEFVEFDLGRLVYQNTKRMQA